LVTSKLFYIYLFGLRVKKRILVLRRLHTYEIVNISINQLNTTDNMQVAHILALH